MSGTGPDRPHLSDRAQYLVLRALARLPAQWQIRLSGEMPRVVDGQTMDAQLQLLCALRRRRGIHGLIEPTIGAGRARYRRETAAFRGPPTPVGTVRALQIDGPSGTLRARHYAPAEPRAHALLVYLHGGGFTIGDLDTHDEPCRILCRHAGTHVLSIDYRLAPEHPFPAALDDTCAAIAWARRRADSLGADPTRIAIGGDSAGANLATVAARLLTRAGAPPAAQLLIYPTTDAETVYPSVSMFADGPFLTAADRSAFARCYLEGVGVPDADPRISPLRATDLQRLPPALVVTAGFDILRDEGEAYAAALSAAGTPARVMRVAALAHGFIHLTGVVPAAADALRRVATEWRTIAH